MVGIYELVRRGGMGYLLRQINKYGVCYQVVGVVWGESEVYRFMHIKF